MTTRCFHRFAAAFAAGLCAATAAPAARAAAAGATAPVVPPRIADAAATYVEAGTYPALVVVMVDDGRDQIAGFGRLADGRAPDAHTVFEIGSVTKTFTALLLAARVQAGAATLETPVASLLPDFAVPSRDGHAITLGLLAEQFSGLPRLPGNLAPADLGDPYADYGRARLQAFLAGYALPREPGAAYEYSNLGFGLLGVALAAQARSSYGELLRREVLAPLGMDSTDVELTPALRARLAPGRDERGAPAPHWRFGALEGAGALLSDGADLLRYLRANMGLAKTPLDTALRLVRTPRRDIGGGDRIGLGWMIRSTPDGDVVWHNGETGGYASFVGFTADGRRGVAILANAVGPPQDLGFAALSPRLPVPAAHAAVALAPDALDAYVGRYALAPGFDLDVFRRDAQLFAQASGQSAFPIFASARDAFFARVGGITLDFERGADGAVAALVLHQGGVDRRAARTASTTDARGARSVALDAAVLGDYVGRYVLMPGVAFDVSVRGGQLYAQLTGQAALPVHASAKDRFFYTAVDATLDFERDAAGRVVALVLHQNGRDQRAPRER